jgi:hypothetical protein
MTSAMGVEIENFEEVGRRPLGLVARTAMTPEIHAEKNELGLDLPVVFMAMNDSERDLEVPRTGTVAKLRKHLCSLTTPETWPDGLDMQFTSASPWGPSVFVMPRTRVAAALLGQVGWDDPGVMSELNLMFGGPVEAARDYIKGASQDLVNSADEAMRRFEAAEREIYNDDSAFAAADAGTAKEEHVAEVEKRAATSNTTPRARRSSTRTLMITPKAKPPSTLDATDNDIPRLDLTGGNVDSATGVGTPKGDGEGGEEAGNKTGEDDGEVRNKADGDEGKSGTSTEMDTDETGNEDEKEDEGEDDEGHDEDLFDGFSNDEDIFNRVAGMDQTQMDDLMAEATRIRRFSSVERD